MSQCHEQLGEFIGADDVLIYKVDSNGKETVNIKASGARDNRELDRNEKIQFKSQIDSQKLAELRGLVELTCFQHIPRRQARNLGDARWVTTWRIKPEGHVIKCRITRHGFKDRQSDLETFAGTATRCGQRLVNSIVSMEDDCQLFSIDVTKAFTKGMTCEELVRLTGEPLRYVEVELTSEDAALLRKIPGYENFNVKAEVLKMLKAVHGLKDAPRAWRKR